MKLKFRFKVYPLYNNAVVYLNTKEDVNDFIKEEINKERIKGNVITLSSFKTEKI